MKHSNYCLMGKNKQTEKGRNIYDFHMKRYCGHLEQTQTCRQPGKGANNAIKFFYDKVLSKGKNRDKERCVDGKDDTLNFHLQLNINGLCQECVV